VRRNQQRSRDRRKCYTEYLEKKLDECEKQHKSATLAMQKAVAFALKENKALRELLRTYGADESEIKKAADDARLNDDGDIADNRTFSMTYKEDISAQTSEAGAETTGASIERIESGFIDQNIAGDIQTIQPQSLANDCSVPSAGCCDLPCEDKLGQLFCQAMCSFKPKSTNLFTTNNHQYITCDQCYHLVSKYIKAQPEIYPIAVSMACGLRYDLEAQCGCRIEKSVALNVLAQVASHSKETSV